MTGKPMGNGLPLAATAARNDLVDAFRAEKDHFNTSIALLVPHSRQFNNILKIRPPLLFTHKNADEFLTAFNECMGETGG